MELSHLLQLVSEIPQNTTLQYVRGTDKCKFVNVDIDGERINSVAPNGEDKSWAPSYLEDLAPKIFENEPFNLSGLLNNKGSYRPVLETIIAHTREFYTVKKGTATALVWIPSKPKTNLELEEIDAAEIPSPKPHNEFVAQILPPEELITKVRESFLGFWDIIDQHGAQTSSYVKKFESSLNPYLEKIGLDYKSIFQVINISQYENIIEKITSTFPEMSFLLNGRKNPGEKYEISSTHIHFKNFLKIIALTDFRANVIAQKQNDIYVAKKTVGGDYMNHLAAMRTKPFLLLAGISGTGKSRIVKEMAFASCPPSLRKDDVTPGNYCMIEVKPNWHDSTELIGYVSSIPEPHYVVTPFVNFLIKAMHNPKAPFFVCLDEMNLAPVEQYFAEFLSVLESRKLVNGEIVSEPLIKSDYTKAYIDNFVETFTGKKQENGSAYDGTTSDPAAQYMSSVFEDIKENGLRLPPNVIVVGTVNMDETTYQFSRKVIDRAMTIEMNEVNFDSMFGDAADTLIYRGDDYVKAINFLPKYTAARDALAVLNDADREYLKENIPERLKSLDAALANTPFRIAYRVENELILYFAALREEQPEATAEALLASAVDDILMMKVLPRIEGDEALLGDDNDRRGPLSLLSDFTEQSYPKAHNKVREMQEKLKANHFTSFWP